MATAAAQSGTTMGGKKIFFGLAIAGLAVLGIYLFFGDQILFYLQSNELPGRPAARGQDEVLVIGYAFEPASLEPTHFDPVTRSHLVDIYEGLVRTNRDLKLQPGLAVSWGMLDSLTWEFRLRPGVTFHDGQPLAAEDVVASLKRAVEYDDSQLKDLLNTIDTIEPVEIDRIRIRTRVPDPLLLHKLAVVYVFPKGKVQFDTPVGTGPYSFVSREDGKLNLARNEHYWGPLPAFSRVQLISEPNRRERLAKLESGEITLLANMPPSAGCGLIEGFHDAEGCEALQNGELQIKSIPSLEVSFLVFNFRNELFSQREMREAIAMAFDPQVFIDIAFGFAKPANQFVSSGVFGFNPEIADREFNLNIAKKEVNEVLGSAFERIVVIFDYPERLEPVGEYVQQQLGQLGLDVELNPLSDAELQNKIVKGSSDFYFLGWRSELGDAGDFLQAIAHSKGLFNGAHYMNKKVDQLVNESRENLEVGERLQQLQDAMQIITEEDVLGVPLFESETIFGFKKDIFFEPRVDGYVFASEIY